MNWKKLLQSNLSQLFSRAPDPEGVPMEPRYFWSFAIDLFFGRGAHKNLLRDKAMAYPKSLLRRVLRPGWRGPIYRGGRVWRRDVLTVSEYMRSLVASNVPLAAGMQAAAREEYRRITRWTPERITGLFSIALVCAFSLLVVGSLVLDIIRQLFNPIDVLKVAMLLALSFWLMRSVILNRNNRLAVYLALEARLAAGAGLSDAMAGLPRFFPRHLVDLVTVGEETGDMEGAFAQFNDSMLQALGMHRHLRVVFRYLGAVFLFQCLILTFLYIKVFPVFVEMNSELYENYTTVAMPPYVERAFALNDVFGQLVYAWPKIAMAGACIALFFAALRFRGRQSWVTGSPASLLFFVPWLRGLVVRHNLGLIALMLHGLLRGGVPLDRALGMCSGTDLHPAYCRWLRTLRESLRSGESLRGALAHTRRRWLIPDSFVGQLEAGEYAGQLPAMLERIAGLYRRDVDKRMQMLTAMVLPLGVLSLGYITMLAYTTGFQLIIGMAEALLV